MVRLAVVVVLVAHMAAGCRALWPYAAGDAGSDATTGLDAGLDTAQDAPPDAPAGEATIPPDGPGVDDLGIGDVAIPAQPTFVQGWVKHFSSIEPDEVLGVTVDAQGGVYASGFLMAGIDFGGGTLGADGLPDGWVAKYSAAGNHQWSILLTGGSYDFAQGVAVTAGRLAVAGRFTTNVDFGDGSQATVGGSSDVGLAFYDRSSGTLSGAWLYGSNGNDGAYSVVSDPAGNTYLAGIGAGSWGLLDGDPLSLGSKGIWIASFAASGKYRWARGFAGNFRVPALAVGGDTVCVATAFFNTVEVVEAQPLTSAGNTDALVFCLEADSGAPRWARHFGNTNIDRAYGVVFDGAGQLHAVGQVTDQVEIVPTGTINALDAAAAFAVRFDPATGQPAWARAYGATISFEANAVAAPLAAGVCLAGAFEGSMTFGSLTHVAAGIDDIFIGCIDASGKPGWSMRLGGDSFDRVEALAAGPSGELYLAGLQEGTGDYGAGQHTAPNDSSDGLLVQLLPGP